MNLYLLKDFFLWCFVFNIGVLVFWFLMLIFAHDWVYRFHGRWFKHISKEHFDAVHYVSAAMFKMMVFVFNLAPYVALCILL